MDEELFRDLVAQVEELSEVQREALAEALDAGNTDEKVLAENILDFAVRIA